MRDGKVGRPDASREPEVSRGNPKSRQTDKDSVRGTHQGQRSYVPHQQAGHMTASDQCFSRRKTLANRGPSTHETSSAGVQNSTKSSDLVFTGRIYIYYETALTLAQLGELDSTFRKNNTSPEFRSNAYALAVWSSIRSGDIRPPQRYELHDNLLRLVPGQSQVQ